MKMVKRDLREVGKVIASPSGHGKTWQVFPMEASTLVDKYLLNILTL